MAKRKFDRDEWMDESRYASTVEDRKAIFDAATATCSHWWNCWTHNIDANADVGRLTPARSIVSEYGSQSGPTLIVGFGPSFLTNLDLIVHFSKTMPIIAVDRAFKPLRNAGANIFMTVSADAQEETARFFEDVEIRRDDRFVFSVVTHPSIWDIAERYADHIRYYGNINPFAPWWNLAAQQYGDHILTTSSGSVVTHSAVDIAYWMGFDSIFTVGNDLCYLTEADAKADTGGHDVIEIDGRPTIHTFERAARGLAQYAALHTDCLFADCSDGIDRGWKKMKLDDAAKAQKAGVV